MRRSNTTSHFKVPGVEATVSVGDDKITGSLEAEGEYVQELLQEQTFTGLTHTPTPGRIRAIDGFFKTDSSFDLGNALGGCELRFPLSGGIAAVRIQAQSTGKEGNWRISRI